MTRKLSTCSAVICSFEGGSGFETLGWNCLIFLLFPQQGNTHSAVGEDSQSAQESLMAGTPCPKHLPSLSVFPEAARPSTPSFGRWYVPPCRQEGESQVWRVLSAWRDVLRQSAPCPTPWMPGRWWMACFRSLFLTQGSSCPSASTVGSDTGPHGLSVEPRWLHQRR